MLNIRRSLFEVGLLFAESLYFLQVAQLSHDSAARRKLFGAVLYGFYGNFFTFFIGFFGLRFDIVVV